MITSAELHRAAAKEGLRFDQAERDYVILLILAGLARIGLANQWVFKGGTCLRHCYYPGYRFSEDIDFTCVGPAAGLNQVLGLVEAAVSLQAERTGVQLRTKNPLTSANDAQAEIPVEFSRGGPRRQSLPAIKVHLTFDEPMLTSPVARIVRPSYADIEPFSIAAYSMLEIVAEKARALLQQQDKWPRPRDLYDLWYITCHKGETFDRTQLRDLFERKCGVRGITPDISRLHSRELYEWNQRAWANQLCPMLKAAPEYDRVWTEWDAKCEDLL